MKPTTIKGYTAQARFWANVKMEADGDTVKILGWTRLCSTVTKPVYQALDGTPIVIVGDADGRAGFFEAHGLTHLQVRVLPCITPIVATEEDLWAKPVETICAWCPDSEVKTADAVRRGCDVNHTMCAACSERMEKEGA